MYERTFKNASIWAILWRSLLSLLGVSILAALFFALFGSEHLTFIGLLTDGLLYFAFYKIVVSQMKKQGLSVGALSKAGKKGKKSLLQITGLTLLVALTATTFTYFIMTVLTFFPSLFDLIMPYIIGMSLGEEVSIVYIFITAVIIAPIVEEVVFRGYILNKWVDKYSINKGIVFSSLLFMIIHIPSFFIPQLLVGLFCGILYVKYRNLFYPIFAHSLYNFIVLLPSFFVSSEANIGEDMMELMLLRHNLPTEYIILSIVFIISLIILSFLLKHFISSVNEEQSPYTLNLEAESSTF